MQFEHIGPDGECKCVDVHISCINIENCIDQAANGYKFKLDGKRIELSEVKKLVGYTGRTSQQSATTAETTTRKVRSIRCLNNGKTYKNMSEAAKDLGLDSAQISYSLKVGRPTKGYEFEFADEVLTKGETSERLAAIVKENKQTAAPAINTPSSAKATGSKQASFAALAKQVKG